MARLGFDVGEVAPDEGGGPIPAGTILEFQVTEESLKAANSGRGDVLSLVLEVIEGQPHAGRKIYVRMNVSHENPVTQRIGQSELAALCRAIGKRIEDTEELLWSPFWAETKVAKENDKNGKEVERSAIRKYIDPETRKPGATKAEPQRPAPAAAQRAPARGGSAPGGGRSVPWGAGRQSAPATTDDDIPF